MSSADLQFVEAIFLKAIELPASERVLFVAGETEGQDELRAAVERLLAFHFDSGNDSSFILDREIPHQVLDAQPTEMGEQIGDYIGPYRLLERIGEGGMGSVYMAEQTRGVQRKVALKIIKLGMDTRQVVARFEAERQAMALFDHPGIARVFDAGATENGRPYFVMELVRGQDIITFVRNRKIGLIEKLKLFVSTCRAVQHAHQKGIIHRDLKPSNILVTLFDGIPLPKVIDFGIAKAIGQKLTDKTLFTRYAAMVGTPQYMSPEQAELSGQDVDTRSDIFSLGVLLYELLTGTTPLDPKKLNSLNPLVLFETLRDADIKTPSSQVSKLTDSSSNVPNDGAFTAGLKNELDWVVMKALARDRGERYATANELAADVQRFIDGDPVSAMPPSRIYQFNSWVKKNRKSAVLGLTIALLVFAWALTSSFLAFNSSKLNFRLSQALENQQRNLDRAEKAEKELVAANVNQLYESAHALTLSKFLANYSVEHEKTFRAVFEKSINEEANHDEKNRIDNPEELLDEMDNAYLFTCFEPDFNSLLEFPTIKKQIDLPLARVQAALNQVEKDTEEFIQIFEDLAPIDEEEGLSIVGGQPKPISINPLTGNLDGMPLSDTPSSQLMIVDLEHGESAHTEICVKVQKEMTDNRGAHRVVFYRILVGEYRTAFGDDSPYVAEALTLLAASMAEVGRLSEAEAHLREAIALTPPDENRLRRRLLLQLLEK